MRRALGVIAAGLLLVLAACATTPVAPPPQRTRALPSPPPARIPEPAVSWSTLPGWAEEDHLAALTAVRAACKVRARRLAEACRALAADPPADDAEARRFIERRFDLYPEPAAGLLTAYYTPIYDARRTPEPPFTAPLRPPPADPALAGADRAAIAAAPADDALAWMRPEDLFFLQVQGSGVLQLPGGSRLKAVYAGSNGKSFVPIGRVMREQGLLGDRDTLAGAIRGWLAAHAGLQAEAVMDQDPRYIFFRAGPDDGAAPEGAAGVVLPPGRAVAADPAFHPAGALLWIDAADPRLTGGRPAYRRLVAALDVGSAIKGPARADLYVGEGEDAGEEAGRVRHRLTLYRLEPR
ncbi:MAG TPA: MltA domain-containing protein [Caulobacteraceae bacterium]